MARQVLLIEDSAMLRRIATGVLHAQPARYEVVAATRASEGFARACSGDAAVILVDERLAGGANADLCRRLLHEPRTTAVPVVLLTGRNGDGPRLDTLPENVVEILSKPFTPEQLAGLVNAITGLAKKGIGLGEMRLTLHPPVSIRDAEPPIVQPLPDEETAKIHDARRASNRPADLRSRASEAAIRTALLAAIAEGETGVLRFCPADGLPTEMFIDRGRLVVLSTKDGVAYSRQAAERLPAKVSPATLQEAASEQGVTGVPFLLTLGARGLVSKAVAVELLRGFGQRHFARLWTLPAKDLHIEFERLEALPGFTLRLEPMRETVDDWLLGSLRILTSRDIAPETRHQGLVGTPGYTPRGAAILEHLTLNDDERDLMRAINGRNDLPTIARTLRISSEDTFVLLYRFRCLEILEYRSAPLPFMMTPRTNLRRVLPLKR